MIIDVRTRGEHGAGSIEGAVNLPLTDILNGDLPDCSLNEPLVLHCRSGGRAGNAKILLEQAGFNNVTNAGGIDACRDLINKLP